MAARPAAHDDERRTGRGPAAWLRLALAGGTALTGTWQPAESVVAVVASLVVAVLAAGVIGWSLAGRSGRSSRSPSFSVPGVADAFARSAIDGLQAALVLSAIAIAHAGPGRCGSWRVPGAVAVGVRLGLAILTKETALALAPWPLLWAAATLARASPGDSLGRHRQSRP